MSYSSRNYNQIGSSRSLPRAMPVSYSHLNKDTNPFGPQMACEVFGVYSHDDPEDCIPYELEDESIARDIDNHPYWYQLDLPIENVREIEERHRQEIKKFKRAYNRMCVHALKWHYLMEDIEDNAQLKKLFNDIQLMRKLGGSNGV